MEDPSLSYDQRHVSFVSSGGSSTADILAVLLSVSLTPLLARIIVPWTVPPSFTTRAVREAALGPLVSAAVEFFFLLLASLAFLTVLAGENEGVVAFSALMGILFATLALLTINHSLTQPKTKGLKEECGRFSGIELKWGDKLPFVTNFRGIIILLTIISILAIDFPVFPRRFAKTKKFGVSLMDIGTGSFIFANGIVSPESRNRRPNLKKSLVSSIPIFILGLVRLVSVKGIQYHEVVEEYGVNWNFFFTLGTVKLLSCILLAMFDPRHSLMIGSFIAISYEAVLCGGLQNDYVLNPEVGRENFMEANREGIYSVPGYLVIFLLSVFEGQMLRRQKEKSKVGDWFIYLLRSLFFTFILFVGFYYWDGVNPSCRRVANLSYVLWTLGSNMAILSVQMLCSLCLSVFQELGLLHGPLLFYSLREKRRRELEKVNGWKERAEDLIQDDLETDKEDVSVRLFQARIEKIQEELKKTENPRDLEGLLLSMENELKNFERSMKAKGRAAEKEKNDQKREEEENVKDLPELAKWPSVTLEAFCFNGLAVFLIANLLTGLVNMLFYTLYVPNNVGFGILAVYLTAINTLSLALYFFRFQLKIW